MKSVRYLFLIVLSTFLSCSNELEESIQQDNYVSFTPSFVDQGSRATDTYFEEGDQIGIFAVLDKGEGKLPGLSGSVYASNVPYKYTANFRFEPMSSGIALPDNKKGLFYYAIYPYSSNLGDNFLFNVRKDQTGNNLTLSDLTVAVTAPSTSKQVKLPFSHVLSKIYMSIGPKYNRSDLIGVELLNIGYKASIDMTTFNILTHNQDDERASIKMHKLANDCFEAIVPPQIIKEDSQLCKLIYQNESVVLTAGFNIKIESGHAYTFETP